MPVSYSAEGRCPYCGERFERTNLHAAVDLVNCFSCGRRMVVETHIAATVKTFRIEGEATRPYNMRFYQGE